MTDTANLLLLSSLGGELTEEEAAVLGNIMTPRELADGDYLIVQGTSDDSLHVLLEGKLEVVKSTGGGDVAGLAVLREGDLAGELSFIDSHEHTVGLRALCRCRILSLKREDFENVIDEHPQIVYKVMRAIARSTHRIVHRMNSEFIELNNYIFKQHGRY
ncbi:MAG: cyclic nucleotide-binding domain-containing protein [Gammaproteobacteria bacterium]|nr:cyclic nucleotide-binding domain-containing protein [Gammaproteobacteria bacterium]MBU2676252.1 cyclic nucleotide-binding domain-containing protein [Gammaproteobacteria bacterium]NNC56640.1 cyclic nucleotide-binding domain-containing protein [Woeseiaceae bacterium]NNL49987.1 cyclic nucleotide-binding domain-containing protein [Woeseiaceae bacterium]